MTLILSHVSQLEADQCGVQQCCLWEYIFSYLWHPLVTWFCALEMQRDSSPHWMGPSTQWASWGCRSCSSESAHSWITHMLSNYKWSASAALADACVISSSDTCVRLFLYLSSFSLEVHSRSVVYKTPPCWPRYFDEPYLTGAAALNGSDIWNRTSPVQNTFYLLCSLN